MLNEAWQSHNTKELLVALFIKSYFYAFSLCVDDYSKIMLLKTLYNLLLT